MRKDLSGSPFWSGIDLTSVQTQADFCSAFKELHNRSGLQFRKVSRLVEKSGQHTSQTLSHSQIFAYTAGTYLPSRSNDCAVFRNLLRSGYGIDDDSVISEWVAALMRVAKNPGRRAADETVPYPGLRPFHEDERPWFFGRDDALEKLRDVIELCIAEHSHSMIALGASGAGKSSLVNIGIPSVVENDEMLGTWRVERMTPGRDPLVSLNAALEARDGERCLLVIDQFEELWADTVGHAESGGFLERLETVTVEDEPPLIAIMVISAGFYPRVLGDGFLGSIGADRRVELAPMGEAQLEAAIESPARAVNVEVEAPLTALLLKDLAEADKSAAGALPLLALALRDMWGRGSKHTMTATDYAEAGGLNDIVERTAEQAFGSLDEADRDIARDLLTGMVSVQDGFPHTRRWLSTEDLDDRRKSHPSVDAVIGRFTESRLLVLDRRGVTLAHEAVLRAWPRLDRWIQADRRRLVAHSELEQAAEKWERHGHDQRELYSGPRIEDTMKALGASPTLSPRQRDFLDASQRRATRLRQGKRAVVAVVTVLVLSLVAALLWAYDQRGEAVRHAAIAEDERIRAESRMIASQSERLRRADPALAAQLAVAAYQTYPTAEARSSLLSATSVPPVTRMPGSNEDSILRMDVNPEGDLLAAAVDTIGDGAVLIWDITDPYRPELVASELPGVDGTILTVKFASEGRLYSAGQTGVVYIHDLSETGEPHLVSSTVGSSEGFNSVAVHEASGTVAAGGPDTRIWLWPDPDLTSAPLLLEGTGGDIASVTISPAGERLAIAAANGLVAVHDLDAVTASTAPSVLDAGYERYLNISFSPDGRKLAAGTSAGPVALWNTADEPELLKVLHGPEAGWSTSVSFPPDGPYLVSAAQDGVWMWNLDTGAEPSHLPSSGNGQSVAVHPLDGAVYAGYGDGRVNRWRIPGNILNAATGPVRNAEFLRDESTFAAVTSDGSIWMWDVDQHGGSPSLMQRLQAPDPGDRLVGNLSVNHDGTLLAGAGREGTIWVWDLTDLEASPAALTGLSSYALQIAFSPVDDRLAAAVDDGTVAVWDLDSDAEPQIVESVSDHWVGAVSFSPDGETLVTSGFEGSVRVWDATSAIDLVELGEPLEGPTQPVDHLVFSRDGSRIAAASHDGNAYLWNTGDRSAGVEPTVLRGNNAWMATVSFNPDDTILAGASADGAAILWKLDGRSEPGRYAVLTGASPPLTTIAFSVDGTMIAGAGGDAVTRLWLTDPEMAADAICAVAGADITEDEWRIQLPSLDYRPPC
ncbi:WD40 repeat domain-containing protein [Glycomyces xiaoerkulensis]|uniref:WD40 repeat domain-containing protein n=1 Tax=Glycomyces xiaoerkulensis TaxID=2038139 RepID=UPI000C266D4B|nr:WD40 repeat domain-containing protein [Glycomyces xiaoerkulensis]